MTFHDELNEIRQRAGLPSKVLSFENITPAIIQDIKRIAKKVHDEEGADVNDPGQVGYCAMVAEILSNKYGWKYVGGVYLSRTLEPIGDHVWNELRDGTIIDPTPLQWHEGHHVRIIPPDDSEHKRYRIEWSKDYNPGMADEYPELKGVPWSGEYDMDMARRLKKERGPQWWTRKKWSSNEADELNEIRRRAGLPLHEGAAMPWDADISQYGQSEHPNYEAAGPFHGHELRGGYDAPAYRYLTKAEKAADPDNGGYSLLLRGENIVEINQITSNRKGGGTAMMDFLTELADKMNIILVLRPEAYDVGERHMPQRLLFGWYQKYGFETTGHHNQMARLPE